MFSISDWMLIEVEVGVCGGVGAGGGCDTNDVSRDTTLLLLGEAFETVSVVVLTGKVVIGICLIIDCDVMIIGFAGAGGMTGLAS